MAASNSTTEEVPAQLQAAVDSVCAEPYVLAVARPLHHSPMSQLFDERLFDVELRVQGPAATAYATAPIHVRLEFTADYPKEPPTLTVLSILAHYLIKDQRPGPSFGQHIAQTVASDASGSTQATAVLVMDTFMAMLKTPLHPCEDCNGHYAAMADAHRSRVLAIQQYAPLRLNAELYSGTWKREWFVPALQRAIFDRGCSREALAEVLSQEGEGVFSFDMFTPEFCRVFLAELDHYNKIAEEHDITTRRPNSMNRYGVIVNEIGLEGAMDGLQALVLEPVAQLLFPVPGSRLDHHHSFMVQYQPGKDTHLDMHTDDSDVTFNVCLGKEFEAAGLTFCGQLGKGDHRQHTLQYPHKLGRCVVHLGTRRHGADHITSGERNNLIVWCHNSTFRSSDAFNAHQRAYQRESAPPDPRCVSYTHDRDYAQYKDVPAGVAASAGWCPPHGAEFDPDSME